MGLLNTIVALIVFATLQWLLSDYLLAGFIAVPICVLFSHATMGRLVFNSTGLGTLIPFATVYAVLGMINAGLISMVVSFGQDPLIGQIVAAPVIAVLSFLGNELIVFRRTG
ncbi:GtrA family protein [Hyphomicrobium sp. D-2]|uniref:GtrA family protein n=1 Tax=Hyphomicrobium sp. D-2 TaxID=3041621 RepID=UPI0024559E3A|nr:GtrA family protein [Hyphomicrobium sp. D-2]MDH4981864.1 GtrA family protein [Hyphomicrobium sp. D-2]